VVFGQAPARAKSTGELWPRADRIAAKFSDAWIAFAATKRAENESSPGNPDSGRTARFIAHRRQIKRSAIDLHERYGPAAYRLARNSARAGGGASYRRHWRAVARRLRRSRLDAC
jgi:hypothetical protein